MNEVELLSEIQDDLRLSGDRPVIYLEGTSDPEFLFALLGLSVPEDGLHQGVLVKGLKDERSRRGTGFSAVQARVNLASRKNLTQIYGILDGDGRPLAELVHSFDPPYHGPIFHWKAYCIENMLVKTMWPSVWGDVPDWPKELAKYGPYVVLNRVGSEARSILKDLGLEKFASPILGSPVKESGDITSALTVGKARLLSFDVEQRFRDEIRSFDAAICRSLDEAHAQLNGKWLLRHLAPTLTGYDPDRCRFEWLSHARSVGGLPEVREWWERVTGSPP